jgi:hypothetical protein
VIKSFIQPAPDYQFPVCSAKWLKNGKLRKAILSAFYNISQRNFGILLILWCSFKLWWNFGPGFRSKFHSKGERSIAQKKFYYLTPLKYAYTMFSPRITWAYVWFRLRSAVIMKIKTDRNCIKWLMNKIGKRNVWNSWITSRWKLFIYMKLTTDLSIILSM